MRLSNDPITFVVTLSWYVLKYVAVKVGYYLRYMFLFVCKERSIHFPMVFNLLQWTSGTFHTCRVLGTSIFSPLSLTRTLWGPSSLIISFVLLKEVSSHCFRFLMIDMKVFQSSARLCTTSACWDAAFQSLNDDSFNKPSAGSVMTQRVILIAPSIACYTAVYTS